MLPAKHRVVSDRDWHRLNRYGATFHAPDAVVKAYRQRLSVTRFGFSIGLKVHKKSTQRNVLKRRLRAIAAAECGRMKTGYDVGIIAKPPLKQLTYQELKERVKQLFTRAHLYV